jgi:hypothetical protein
MRWTQVSANKHNKRLPVRKMYHLIGLGLLIPQIVVVIYSIASRGNFWFHSVLLMIRASKRNDARRNKTALGPLGRDETSLKMRTLGPIKQLVNFHKYPSRMSRKHILYTKQ